MGNNLFFYLSLSVAAAALIGLVRYRDIGKDYYPFIWYLWLSVLVELLVYFADDRKLAVQLYNWFALAEFVLFSWQFQLWGLFGQARKRWVFVLLAAVAAWVSITFFSHSYTEENMLFRIISYFSFVFFSVSMVNRLIAHEQGSILKSSRFLICMGVIIIYAFGVLNAAVNYILWINLSPPFKYNVFKIYAYTNFFVNLIYALAMLWAPKSKIFTRVF